MMSNINEVFSSKPQQIAQAIVRVSSQIFGKTNGIKCIVLGDQNIVISIGQNLKKFTFKKFSLNNQSLLKFFDGNYENLVKESELHKKLCKFDVFLIGVNKASKIISMSLIKKILNLRKQKPLFLIEGGVPGNIDPCVSKLSNLFLYDLNDLEQFFSITQKNTFKDGIDYFIEDLDVNENLNSFVNALNLSSSQKKVFFTKFKFFLDKNTDIEFKKKLFNFFEIFRG